MAVKSSPLQKQWMFLREHRGFTNLWLGQSISYFGDHIYTFATLWWALYNRESAIAASVILLIVTATNLTAGPWIGTVVDQLNRRNLLVFVVSTYSIVTLATGALMLTDTMTLPLIYLFTGVTSLLDIAYYTSLGTLVPSLLPHEKLRQGNGLMESTRAIGGIIAPAVGGGIARIASIGWLPIINAFTFLLNLFFLRSVRPGAGVTANTQRSLWENLTEGLTFLRGHGFLLFLLVILGLVNLPMAPMGILVPAVILQDLELGPAAAGLATSVFAAGVFLCTQLFSWVRINAGDVTLLVVSIFVLGVGNLLVGLAPNLYVLLPGSLLAGGATIALILSSRTLLQKVVPQDLLGRVLSWNRALGMGLRPIGILGFAALADIARPQVAVLGAAVLMLAFACVSAFAVRHRVLES
jgi:DHA3 family macrolide efflux protein-like MFS transporter